MKLEKKFPKKEQQNRISDHLILNSEVKNASGPSWSSPKKASRTAAFEMPQ